ncbi:MAG: pectinesterase family protein [Calditrichia bacterium]
MNGSFPRFIFILFFSMLMLIHPADAQTRDTIVVDKNGNGDYETLSKAIASLPMFNYQRVTIFIKPGIYNEKIRIEQDYITLEGEDRASTIIQYNQLREDWNRGKDTIGPAVINIHADDIILKNLTIKNTQPQIGPHAFAIYGDGTRTILLNCTVVSRGGDTVSLWNYKTGMYYHANCSFEGAVDFVCPRGWCFIRDSKFYEMKKTAAIWHAGGNDMGQKLVIMNSSFDGVKDFQLGRHHYEAQFYLINCTFSQNMSDRPIYRVTYEDSTRNRPFNWGKRYYFSDCHRIGGDFEWFADNLNNAAGAPSPDEITLCWTFEGRWDPESSTGPGIVKFEIHKNYILLYFDDIVTVKGIPELISDTGKHFTYYSGGGSDTIRFNTPGTVSAGDLPGLKISNAAKLLGSRASVCERPVSLKIQP